MTEVGIRILRRNSSGEIEDCGEDFTPSDFAGVIPAIGDHILDPGVPGGMSREDPANRSLWLVVDRFFNPKDNRAYVGIVVEERPLMPGEYGLV